LRFSFAARCADETIKYQVQSTRDVDGCRQVSQMGHRRYALPREIKMQRNVTSGDPFTRDLQQSRAIILRDVTTFAEINQWQR